MIQDINVSALLSRRPNALAVIKGGRDFPNIRGQVYFYQINAGVIVVAKISGLPFDKDPCKKSIFGFHIHEGESCTGTDADEFRDRKSRLNSSHTS